MALGKQVEDSLKEAEANLRNSLAFAARTERPGVVSCIADLIHKIDVIISTDNLLDKLENRKEGDSGTWEQFFLNDEE